MVIVVPGLLCTEETLDTCKKPGQAPGSTVTGPRCIGSAGYELLEEVEQR